LNIPLVDEGLWSVTTTGLETTELSGFTRESAQNTGTIRASFALVASRLVVQNLQTALLITLEFERSPLPGTRYSAIAGDLNTWDVIVLSVPFLGPNRELQGSVTSGEIIVRANWL